MKKNDHRKYRLTPCKLANLIATSFLLSGFATAQEQTPNWYQVEIIVFTQTLTATDTQESWSKDIALAYPPGSTALKTQQQLEAQQLQESELLQSVEQNLENGQITQKNTHTLNPEENLSNPNEASNSVNSETVSASSQQNPLYEDEDNIERVNTPEPFIILDEEEQSLSAIKSSLSRHNNYRVLTHKAWRQPAYEHDTEKAVILTGGDLFDDHYELEGTLTLRVSRYLHVETNLWLTQFYPNYGEASGYTEWPPLPQLPSLQSPLSSIPVTNQGSEQALSSPENNPGFESETTATEKEHLGALPNNGLTLSDAAFDKPSFTFSFNQELDSLTNQTPGYIIDRIVLNKQSRKMRSGELHYLDHPVLGAIVKVTPWQQPDNSETEPGDTDRSVNID